MLIHTTSVPISGDADRLIVETDASDEVIAGILSQQDSSGEWLPK
jgi:hypothetical protein